MKSSFWAIAMMPLQSPNFDLRNGCEIVPVIIMIKMERAREKLVLGHCNDAAAITQLSASQRVWDSACDHDLDGRSS